MGHQAMPLHPTLCGLRRCIQHVRGELSELVHSELPIEALEAALAARPGRWLDPLHPEETELWSVGRLMKTATGEGAVLLLAAGPDATPKMADFWVLGFWQPVCSASQNLPPFSLLADNNISNRPAGEIAAWFNFPGWRSMGRVFGQGSPTKSQMFGEVQLAGRAGAHCADLRTEIF